MAFELPVSENAHYAGLMASYSIAGVLPNFEYSNVSGQFKLHESVGEAIYKYFDNNFYSDKLSYLGRVRLGQPDDDFNHVGFDSGYIYKVTGEEFYFLFSDIPFRLPSLAYDIFRLYSSEDGTTWVRWKTPNGTSRTAIPALPPPPPPPPPPGGVVPPPGGGGGVVVPPPPPPPPPLTDDKLKKVEAALRTILSPLAIGNEGHVDVSLTRTSPTAAHIDCSVTMKHTYQPPSAAGWKPPKITLYEKTDHVVGDIDSTDPDSASKIKACVGLPSYVGGGESCVSLGEIAAILAA